MLAYCFMPDHVHLLLESDAETTSLVGLISHWKQTTGFYFNQCYRSRLWQPGFYDRVLREHESHQAVAAYILANPVRAGISRRVGEYPFAWCEWGNDVGMESRG